MMFKLWDILLLEIDATGTITVGTCFFTPPNWDETYQADFHVCSRVVLLPRSTAW